MGAVDGIEAKHPAPLSVITATNPDARDAEPDALFSRVPVTVRHAGSQPYYQPSGDHVVMPEFADFHTGDDYFSTLAHELCHATGHVDRLARPTLISTKREDYAREELVAELGAAFVSGAIGIKLHDREDHAAIWRAGFTPSATTSVASSPPRRRRRPQPTGS